ncbi:hypothetical protein S7711_09867 [Stachybotrys chartarum IBT 7711]|uniref:SnoaL-like domain-containing protein n=1 Tax=Stachybotrys chartarum (strain CBS 109288 / IBT 7711) TaxID=1280523 RepID=A0A084AZF0_STACB|nr:hypothetical protein S7711_09867 [Stachybotrys chartarum IBT 7711]
MATRELIEETYRDWIAALNSQNDEAISAAIAEKIMHDGLESGKHQYTQQVIKVLDELSVTKVDLDMFTIDTAAQAISARLLYRGKSQINDGGIPTNDTFIEWSAITFTWFDADLKMIRASSLVDMDAIRAGNNKAAPTPTLHYEPAPPGFGIQALYHGYLDCINTDRDKDRLARHVHSVITHNEHMSDLDEFLSFLNHNSRQIEGNKLTIKDLITDDVSQQIAARLELSGTPVGEVFGSAPTGRAVRFPEHAMYKLHGGKIAFVWAVRDFDTFRKRLEGRE